MQRHCYIIYLLSLLLGVIRVAQGIPWNYVPAWEPGACTADNIATIGQWFSEAQELTTAAKQAVGYYKTNLVARKLFTSYFGIKWTGGRGGATVKSGYRDEWDYLSSLSIICLNLYAMVANFIVPKGLISGAYECLANGRP
jgi:hypothetical protein